MEMATLDIVVDWVEGLLRSSAEDFENVDDIISIDSIQEFCDENEFVIESHEKVLKFLQKFAPDAAVLSQCLESVNNDVEDSPLKTKLANNSDCNPTTLLSDAFELFLNRASYITSKRILPFVDDKDRSSTSESPNETECSRDSDDVTEDESDKSPESSDDEEDGKNVNQRERRVAQKREYVLHKRSCSD